jgi:hypothetical protein
MFGQTPLFGERQFHWPPMSSLASKIVGLNPWARRYLAATIPDGPPPITATVRLSVGCLLRFRSKLSPTLLQSGDGFSLIRKPFRSNAARPHRIQTSPHLIGARWTDSSALWPGRGSKGSRYDLSFPKEGIGREIRSNCPQSLRSRRYMSDRRQFSFATS